MGDAAAGRGTLTANRPASVHGSSHWYTVRQMDRLGWQPTRGTSLVLGTLLVVAGIALFLSQHIRVDLGQYGWPVFVIAPGLALIAAGLVTAGASRLIVPGAIVTTTGLVLAVQNTFNLWATWAYAWALIAPGAAGLGVALQGRVTGSAGQVQAGLRSALVGLVLFVVLGAFFEGALHLSGLYLGGFGEAALPVALIVLGLVLLATTVTSRRPAGSPGDAPAPPPSEPPPAG